MKQELISLYIDNELDLDEKIDFVETVHGDGQFKSETIDLLNQERWLRSDAVDFVPPVVVPDRPRRWTVLRRNLGWFASGLVAAMLVALIGIGGFDSPRHTNLPQSLPDTAPYRFVVYQPDVTRAEIIGSFTGWRPVSMTPIDGYWELMMMLPEGEHRFSYVFDGERQVPDPTIPGRETDDFGGENSILHIRRAI